MAHQKLGEILIQQGLISEEQLKDAISRQKRERGRLGEILVKMGTLTEDDIIAALGTQLNLPYANKDLFIDWLTKQYPLRAGKILNRIRDVRGGKLNSSEWGERFSGKGEIAEAIHRLFKISCEKYGLNKQQFHLTTSLFRRHVSNQLEMFS